MLRELASYHRPATLRDALELLQQPHTLALAGGTELLGRDDKTTAAVIDMQDAGLDYVQAGAEGIRMGAMTRLASFIDYPALNRAAGGLLRRAAALLAGTEREAATIGGTLAAARADSELVASLLALDAEVVVQTASSRTELGLDALLGEQTRYLTPAALITELFIPAQAEGAWFGLERVSRTPADRAIVCVAARMALREGKAAGVRMAAGGVAAHSTRLSTAEAVLEGVPLDGAAVASAVRAAEASVSPSGDQRASAEYRRAMLGMLLARLLNEAMVFAPGARQA